MSEPRYTEIIINDRPEFQTGINRLISSSWPKFMLQDSVAHRYWYRLYEVFPGFQFALVESDGETIIAAGNSLPLAWEGDPDDLPEEGWDWALARGFEDHEANRNPRVICALSITVAGDYRGRGISVQMVKAMRNMGRAHGFRTLIAPVRPNLKSLYPLIPMERYVEWHNDEGLPFDPWMRVHSRLDAQIAKVCSQSIIILGTLPEWEKWTGLRFPESGQYIVPHALVPVAMDRALDQGEYIEPNVWMIHSLQ